MGEGGAEGRKGEDRGGIWHSKALGEGGRNHVQREIPIHQVPDFAFKSMPLFTVNTASSRFFDGLIFTVLDCIPRFFDGLAFTACSGRSLIF